MTKLIPIISDIQYPLQDPRAIDLTEKILDDINARRVFCVGDELDNWQIGRWSKGFAEEYDGNLGTARDGVKEVLTRLGVTDLSRSNHGEARMVTYLKKYAPALELLPEMQYENFMGLKQMGINYHRQPVEVAPGWMMVHGDEASLIQTAGGTAMNIAKRWGASIVCGHSHRMGIQHSHISWGGVIQRELWGFEVGNLMDMEKALYLKGGFGNWQQGFGVLAVDGDNVTPIAIPFHDHRAYFDGKTYKA